MIPLPSRIPRVAVLLACLSLLDHVNAAGYETPSPGNASDYLSQPGGVSYQLDARVENDGFVNQYRIRDGGKTTIPVQGTDFARERMHELGIIDGIFELRQSGAFTEGSLAGPGKPAVDNAKRQLAVEFGVDPYSSNAALQQALEELAQAVLAGDMTLDLGLRASAAGMEPDTPHYLLYSPELLKGKIKEHLSGARLPFEKLDELLAATRCSLRHAASAAGILVRLDLPQGNQPVFSWLLRAQEENECRRRLHMLELAFDYRRRKTISELWVSNDQLYWRDTVDNEGIAIVADHLFWTRKLETLLGELESIYKAAWVSGQVSKRVASELGNRGITLSAKRFERLKDRDNFGNVLLEGSALPELERLPVNRTVIADSKEPPAEEPVDAGIDKQETVTRMPEPVPEPEPEPAPVPEPEPLPVVVEEETPTDEEIAGVPDTSTRASAGLQDQRDEEVDLEVPAYEEATVSTPPVEEAAPVQAKQSDCWEHPGLGRFVFSAQDGRMTLTHEIIEKNESRHFKLRIIGKQYYWSTSNVVHVFTRYKEDMTLTTNIYNNKKDFPLARCK